MSFRFVAEKVSIEIDGADDVAELLMSFFAKISQQNDVQENTESKRSMTNAERCKKYREKKNMSNDTKTTQNDMSRHENDMKRHENDMSLKEKEEKEKSSKKEKEEKEILINTSANAEVQRGENRTAEQQTSRKTATPDDSEYWAFARDNAEMAEAFHKETGLVPIKSQFGRWINDLRDLAEAGISVEQMRKTVQYMRSENLPICAPGSLLKTAQWLKARGSVPVKSKKGPAPGQPDRWDKAAENLKAEMISSDIFGFLGNPQEVIDV